MVRDVFGAEISEGWIVHQSSIRSYGVDLSGVCEQIWDQRAIYCELVFGSFLKHRLCEVDKMAAALDVQSSTSPISMFLLAGQSNMAGRGEVPPDFEDDPRIRVIAADGTWKIAKHPLHADKPEKAGVGPGISFAKSIVASVSVSPANTGQGIYSEPSQSSDVRDPNTSLPVHLVDSEDFLPDKIGLLPCAFGGSEIQRWIVAGSKNCGCCEMF